MKHRKHSLRLLALPVLAALAVSLSIPAAGAFFWNKAVPSPAMSAFAKESALGSKITFSAEDFTSRLSSGAELDGIVISSLPDTQLGTLKLGLRNVVRGEGISFEDIGSLSFLPTSTEEAFTSFSFIPVFSTGDGDQSEIMVGLTIGKNKNGAPAAEDISLETYMDVAISGKFKSVDPEGDAVTYKVIDRPKKGEIKAENGEFSYIPAAGKTGSDQFTYVATDAFGNTSEPATVTVKVKKRNSGVNYADMDQKAAHYAAIRLHEMGVYTGEKIGESYFLHPDEVVSRGEFVAMAVSAADIALPAAALSTGLDDDGAINVWLKPYVAAAMNAGVVNGSAENDGTVVFRADDGITRAEAAVILNRLANISDAASDVFFADIEAVPTWARDAAVALSTSDILPVFEDGTLRPEEVLTRGEAVQLFYDTLRVIEERGSEGGLLSWAKK